MEVKPDRSDSLRYIEDMLMLKGASHKLGILVMGLFPYLNSEETLVINRHIKDELVKMTGLTRGTVDNAFTQLTSLGILHRIGRGVYELDPLLLAVRTLDDNEIQVNLTYYQSKKTIQLRKGEE